MPDPRTPSLRERKKREMRQHISDTATALFRERGFDGVTVNEIAKAADVSAMTVFNHFPRKEDLFLDRIPEAVDLAVGAVREREPGEEPLDALRRTLLELADRAHPLSALNDSSPPFLRIVLGSPALRARAREALAEVEDALAGALADAGVADSRLAAALAIAAYRTVFVGTAERLLAGERGADVADDHRARLETALGRVEYALGAPPPPAHRASRTGRRRS